MFHIHTYQLENRISTNVMEGSIHLRSYKAPYADGYLRSQMLSIIILVMNKNATVKA